MAQALIGFSGFVGGNLDRQASFSERYNSKNIDDIAGRRFDLVVSAGAPAVKWLANQEPEKDRAAIQRLREALDRIETRRFILISSVDVYAQPVGVDEDTAIDPATLQPYGRHRIELEQFVARRFPGALIVRLPGLFGRGLKKNAIYDLLNDNCLHLVHQDGVFQFYNLEHLWQDIQIAERGGLRSVNFATEPVSVAEMSTQAFGKRFENHLPAPAPRYDFHTKHAQLWGKSGPYLADKHQVLNEIRSFVESAQRSAR